MMRLFLTFGYLDFQKISESNDDFLDLLSEFSCGCKDQSLALSNCMIDLLKNADGERGGFPSTGLCLGNDIAVFENGHNGPLLNGRRTLETWKQH